MVAVERGAALDLLPAALSLFSPRLPRSGLVSDIVLLGARQAAALVKKERSSLERRRRSRTLLPAHGPCGLAAVEVGIPHAGVARRPGGCLARGRPPASLRRWRWRGCTSWQGITFRAVRASRVERGNF